MSPQHLAFLKSHFSSDNFQIVPLAGDASSRRYYRIVQEPKTYVLMSWDPFPDTQSYPFLNVRNHFAQFDIHVPEVIDVAPELGLILLEDLGDLTLERKFWENQDQTESWPFYEQAIDELVKIHGPASKDRTKTCAAFQIAFDTQKFMWEMNYGKEHLFEKLAHISLEPSQEKDLQKIFLNICEILDREPKFISHRDYHSRNLMIKYGKVRVIDFQDARMGPVQYDLVSLFEDSYVQLSRESRKHLINNYLDQNPVDQTRDHFDHIYKLQTIQRCFKACGSFASFYNMRGDKRYLKYLTNTLKTVARQLKEFKEYRFFAQLIEDNGLLERSYDL